MSQRRIYLMRHGATDANLRRPYVLQGQRSNLPLSATGRLQAEAAARVLASCAIAHLFTSPMLRATETAEIINTPHRSSIRTAADFTECDVGRWEGLSWEQIRRQDPAEWQAFDADPANSPYAGGESYSQVQDRAVPTLNRLLTELPAGDLVLVTHNIVARVIVAHALSMPIANARGLRLDNGGITVLATDGPVIKLLTLNSAFHLDGLLIE